MARVTFRCCFALHCLRSRMDWLPAFAGPQPNDGCERGLLGHLPSEHRFEAAGGEHNHLPGEDYADQAGLNLMNSQPAAFPVAAAGLATVTGSTATCVAEIPFSWTVENARGGVLLSYEIDAVSNAWSARGRLLPVRGKALEWRYRLRARILAST